MRESNDADAAVERKRRKEAELATQEIESQSNNLSMKDLKEDIKSIKAEINRFSGLKTKKEEEFNQINKETIESRNILDTLNEKIEQKEITLQELESESAQLPINDLSALLEVIQNNGNALTHGNRNLSSGAHKQLLQTVATNFAEISSRAQTIVDKVKDNHKKIVDNTADKITESIHKIQNLGTATQSPDNNPDKEPT
ncbi:MAG: hypothetical protein HRT90_10815 [Candidatus Margulisbacteria bacterium]|nr:hypothetical protein [Candidatus Margulisiibacteriota bacterium]